MKPHLLSIKSILVGAAMVFAQGIGFAQTVGENSPQIMTSDLSRKQIIKTDTKVVSFVFADDDKITEIEINGISQSFEAADTVVLTKKFRFKPGKTLIEVVARDEAGNTRQKSYLVGYQDDSVADEKSDKKSDFFFKVKFGLTYELDDNPTNDFSTPVKIEGLDVQGVVDDDEQPDYRTVVNATVLMGTETLSGFVGGVNTEYQKSENDFLNSQAVYAGLGLNLKMDGDTSFVMNYIFTDVNVAEKDFSQAHTLSPGFLFRSSDNDGFYKHLLAVSYTATDFADETKNDDPSSGLKWEYNSLDKEKQDNFRFLAAVGTSTSGTEESEVSYKNMDFDWENLWDSDFKWDLGFGIQHREFKNEEPLTKEFLGDTRVDLPLRFSTAMGVQFNPDWKLLYKYRYVFNLSNKSVYVRTIHGLTLNGGF